MYEFLSEVLKSLQPLGPVVQGAFVILIATIVVIALRRGEKDRKNGGAGAVVVPSPPVGTVEIPSWAIYGPVHEVMQTVHDIAEESRKTNSNLADAVRLLNSLDHGQEHTHKLLENILRNQELRPDVVPTSITTPQKRKQI